MLDALKLDQMRMFVAVAEEGSFRSAAKRLERAQSAVSHSVGNLEAELGVELLDRSKRRPLLTSAGTSLLADMRAVLVKVDTMRGRARGLGEGVELEIILALDPQFPLKPLCAALAELHRRHPNVALRILSTPLGASLDALLDRTCDIALAGIDMIHPAIEVEALGPSRRAAVAASGHPLAKQDAASLSNGMLADHVQVVAEDRSPRTADRDHGVVSPLRWRVADNLTKKAVILAGIGWGSLPLWMIGRELADGTLKRLPVAAFAEGGETSVETYLAHRADRPLGPAGTTFRDALLRELEEADPAGHEV